MKKCRVVFQQEKKVTSVPYGISVLEAMIRAGIDFDAPCGGNGKCKKCKVLVNGKEVLACQKRIEDSVEVSHGENRINVMATSGAIREMTLCPEVSGLVAAFDIGTTTLVGYLMDPSTGKLLSITSMLNPQVKFGADVIARCNFALQQGMKEVEETIHHAVDEMVGKLCIQGEIQREEVRRVYCVGNTCMHHLFHGLPVDHLVRAPYEPYEREARRRMAKTFDIHISEEGEVLWLPCIAGFVGADTVGCMIAADFLHREKMTLLLDVGTNGEMVLGDKRRCMSCSTAAGPALEGANISCGMRGAEGAVQHMSLNEKSQIVYDVIGGKEPEGICGSGLIDGIALLLDCGLIEDDGRLKTREELSPEQSQLYGKHLVEKNGQPAFRIAGEVMITQRDIREVQLAKGAVASGILLLTKHMGISLDQIEEILIAGAFGNYMDPVSACRVGLLPARLKSRIIPIGNAAGEGAKLAALSSELMREADVYMKNTESLKLERLPEFQDVFVEELAFAAWDEREDEDEN